MATIYGIWKNQYKYKCHILFSARFYEINEEDQRSDEIELFIFLNNNHKITESDNNNIDVKSQIQHQNQIQETTEKVWMFHKINSMKVRIHKTEKLNGSIFVKLPLSSSSLIKIKKDKKYRFIWSFSHSIHPCKKGHPDRVSIYRQCFNEINLESFDFSNDFKCSDM